MIKFPKKLNQAIQNGKGWEDLNKTLKSKVYSIIIYIFNRDKINEYPDSGWVEIPVQTLRTKFTSKHLGTILNFLLDNEIIQQTNYSNYAHKCKKYRVSPMLLNDFQFETLTDKVYNHQKKVMKETKVINLFNYNDKLFIDDFFNIQECGIAQELNASEIKNTIQFLANSITEDDYNEILVNKVEEVLNSNYKTNEEITKKSVTIQGKFRGRNWTIENICEMHDKVLIQDRNKFYVFSSVEEFKQRKVLDIQTSWAYAIDNLLNNNIYVSRNDNNFRLDTNFTQISKHVFNKIAKENRLVEIDFKNSQFAIIANMILHRGIDLDENKEFCDAAISGKLYDVIAENLSLTRTEAKQMMMEIAFTNDVREMTDAQKHFSNIFPYVASFIRNVKLNLRQQNEKFPVLLQRIESHIVIDLILPALTNLNVEFITKHDSIWIHELDKPKVMETIKAICDSIGFQVSINGTYEGSIEALFPQEKQEAIEYINSQEIEEKQANIKALPTISFTEKLNNLELKQKEEKYKDIALETPRKPEPFLSTMEEIEEIMDFIEDFGRSYDDYEGLELFEKIKELKEDKECLSAIYYYSLNPEAVKITTTFLKHFKAQ